MARRTRKKPNKSEKPMLFTPLNYKIMGLGILLVIIGFTIMRIENEVYGFISLYVSPVIIMSGYGLVAWAILKRDHPSEELSNSPSE